MIMALPDYSQVVPPGETSFENLGTICDTGNCGWLYSRLCNWARWCMGIPLRKSLPAVTTVTLLAALAWLASTQTTIKSLQLSYVLWAFVGGLFISNVIEYLIAEARYGVNSILRLASLMALAFSLAP